MKKKNDSRPAKRAPKIVYEVPREHPEIAWYRAVASLQSSRNYAAGAGS